MDLKIITNIWSITDYAGKNSKINAVEPNIIKELETVVGNLEEANDDESNNVKKYIESLTPAVLAHVILSFSFSGKRYYYSHCLWQAGGSRSMSNNLQLNESFLDSSANIPTSFVLSNSFVGSNYLINSEKLAEFPEGVMLFKEKSTDEPLLENYKKRLPLFGISNEESPKLVQLETFRDRLKGFFPVLLSKFLYGRIVNTKSPVLDKEPTITYYEDKKDQKRLLTYEFKIRKLTYLAQPNILNNILLCFSS